MQFNVIMRDCAMFSGEGKKKIHIKKKRNRYCLAIVTKKDCKQYFLKQVNMIAMANKHDWLDEG